jgi:predicted Rossmann fold flavoprotein
MKDGKNIIVVGGGASGMIAAISARRLGATVTILEKNPRVGKKILATGNGRCNFSNVNTGVEYYNGNNPEFVHSALSSFTVDDTIRFFEKLGIQHKVEDFGKIFPMSDQASSVLDVLLYELKDLGINILCNANVTVIFKDNSRFTVKLQDGKTYHSDRLILATGGKAMPSSGSDGSGHVLAKQLGHSVTDTFPALVQLMLEGPYFKRIEGVKFVGTAEVICEGRSIAGDRGDILFANYGVSGPPILQVSRKAGELLNAGKEVYIKVSIFDTMSRQRRHTALCQQYAADAQS